MYVEGNLGGEGGQCGSERGRKVGDLSGWEVIVNRNRKFQFRQLISLVRVVIIFIHIQ